MGNPSRLRFIPASTAATPIDWTRIPEETKKFLIQQYGYDWDKEEDMPLPGTIGDLAKMFDDTKFFGYLTPGVHKVLMDISEFGLQPTRQSHTEVGPRFYMTYIDQVWFILFEPGTRECIVGNSNNIVRSRNDNSEKRAADEMAMAQEFDVRLEEAASRGIMPKWGLSGWTTVTAQDSLEFSQYAEAIMTLPSSHPAHHVLLQAVFRK